MNWSWFHRLAAPKSFYYFSKRWEVFFLCFGALLLIVGVVWGLAFAPQDYLQGNSFRIIYIHVPAAIVAQGFYVAMGVAAFIQIVWRMKLAPVAVQAFAPVGALMAALALITGSIWGRPTWGTWWEWDARITSVLILFIMYLGIIAIHNTYNDRKLSDKLSAVVALVGLINLPIIKYSVDWWNTLHQPATFSLTEKPKMPVEMWLPLLFTVIGLYLVSIGIAFIRMQTYILEREKKTRWVESEMTNDF
ncbi:heme ABC transporter permease [Marinomonas mediterranea]|jgi:heme exporter protein CcmC|uniref:Heme exporter protein C n=1 Tax=Marinomonas mediterranea (strain ATCC 700492 / JCM 21426 / NBRC 103028 / MMB-1) TaxID=717774 RepID=F2K3H9_MARM1|nr:heme ABC transporter permease [Marinomonas mediterranea]ADZ92418.1 heme exporter protein CcmC [Marinomonas mediterranea MMB-1]WCN18469.1 heme ABC transporter permease [Marinomonas mediterranea MMB-1]